MRYVSFSNLIIDLDRVLSAEFTGSEFIFLCEGNQRFVVDNGSAQQASACWAALLAATHPVDLNAPPAPRSEQQKQIAELHARIAAERQLVTHLRKELDSDTQTINKLKGEVADQAAQIAELRETRKQEVTPLPRTFVCTTCNKARPLDEDEIDDPPALCSDCALSHVIKTRRLEAGRLNRVIADQAAQIADLRETRKQEVATTLAQMARKDQERDELLARGRGMLDGAQLLRSHVIGVLSALQSDDAPDVADVAAALRDMFDKWLHAANAW